MKARSALFGALFLVTLPGCFPVVATGVGASVLVAADRRSGGAQLEDQEIEFTAGRRIDERFDKAIHVNVTSFNRHVLLTGEVTDDGTKATVERLVRDIRNVRSTTNELRVAGVSSLTSRSNDSLITGKVKARFVDADRFQANHVKVVTENGVVYLMGLVTPREANEAIEIASTTSGVERVVKVFEYIE